MPYRVSAKTRTEDAELLEFYERVRVRSPFRQWVATLVCCVVFGAWLLGPFFADLTLIAAGAEGELSDAAPVAWCGFYILWIASAVVLERTLALKRLLDWMHQAIVR